MLQKVNFKLFGKNIKGQLYGFEVRKYFPKQNTEMQIIKEE